MSSQPASFILITYARGTACAANNVQTERTKEGRSGKRQIVGDTHGKNQRARPPMNNEHLSLLSINDPFGEQQRGGGGETKDLTNGVAGTTVRQTDRHDFEAIFNFAGNLPLLQFQFHS